MSQISKYKRRFSFAGIDASGENHVLPPTFPGIKEFVRRAGSIEAAAVQFPQDSDDQDSTRDIVEDFVNELRYCDKAERVQLIRDFSEYVSSLEESSGASQASEGNGGTQGPSSEPSIMDNLPKDQSSNNLTDSPSE